MYNAYRLDSDREPIGHKTMVKIQCQKIEPMKEEKFKHLPIPLQKMSDKKTKRIMHRIWANVCDIETKDKLADVVRHNYGFGLFNVNFWNRMCKNKKYNPNFVCLIHRGYDCKYYSKCKLWTRHKKGWACKMNPKHRPNWSTRARIEILPPINDFTKLDYRYKWDKRKNLMHYFWFWKLR